MKRLWIAGLWLYLVTGVYCGPACGSDLFVAPGGHDAGGCGDPLSPCKTIQYAIDHVGDGDLIKVVQGGYYENVRIFFRADVNDFALQGGWNGDFSARSNTPSVTAISGGGRDTVIVIDPGYESRAVTVEGFMIRHGIQDEYIGGGVEIQAAFMNQSVTLKNNMIALNVGVRGGGVFADVRGGGSLELVLSGNRIVNNNAESGGGLGIVVSPGGILSAKLTNNVIARNHSDLSIGAEGVYFRALYSSASMEIVNNSFYDNGLSFIVAFPSDPLTVNITNTIIDGTLNLFYYADDDIMVRASHSILKNSDDLKGGKSVTETESMVEYTSSESLFIDPSGGDYHLRDDSPAVGQGVCGDAILALNPANDRYERIAPYEDFEGDLRPPDWEETGCDIGADEVVPVVAVPDQKKTYSYDQAGVPALVDRPGECEPFAVGDLTDGTLDLRVVLPRFTDAVDIYLGLLLGPVDSENIYVVQPDDSLHALVGNLVPWRANSPGGIDHRLYGEVPISILAAGRYDAYVLVTPGGDLSTHYLWATYFEIP